MSVRILAHRANIHGPSAATENSLAAIETALARGWGLEIDIRRAATGEYYISHDLVPTPQPPYADTIAAAIRRSPHALVALNVKEIGGESDLLQFLEATGILPQCFLFDMELIEPHPGEMARRFRTLDPDVCVAARVSERREPIERALAIEAADVIWLDEFDGPWATEADVRRLRDSGREIYAVSPDLHGRSLSESVARWRQFMAWGVDGICTDFPAELEQVLAAVPEEMLS